MVAAILADAGGGVAVGKAGRPTLYTAELADRICAAVAEADVGLRKICAANPDFPDRTTIIRWLAQHDEFTTKYARAREGQADAIEEDMIEIEQKVAAKKMKADAARVILWSKQWRASKLGRSKYGDRQQVEHSGEVGVRNLGAIMRERAAKRRANEDQ